MVVIYTEPTKEVIREDLSIQKFNFTDKELEKHKYLLKMGHTYNMSIMILKQQRDNTKMKKYKTEEINEMYNIYLENKIYPYTYTKTTFYKKLENWMTLWELLIYKPIRWKKLLK